MGAKKYSNELKNEIRVRRENGETVGELSKAYNIPYRSIDYICENTGIGTRGYIEHVKNDESVWIDSKFDDARNFKLWKDRLIRKLQEGMKYLEQPIIYIGQNEFTYRCRYGYNDTKAYIDLYKAKKK